VVESAYDVLAAVGDGCVRDSERMWSRLEYLVESSRLPERVIALLFDATAATPLAAARAEE
jgi:hypothetical protein